MSTQLASQALSRSIPAMVMDMLQDDVECPILVVPHLSLVCRHTAPVACLDARSALQSARAQIWTSLTGGVQGSGCTRLSLLVGDYRWPSSNSETSTTTHLLPPWWSISRYFPMAPGGLPLMARTGVIGISSLCQEARGCTDP